MSATYVYCVVASARPPRLDAAPKGLPGTSRPRLLEIDRGLVAIIASAPLSRYSEAAINRGLANLDWVSAAAMAHEALVEHFVDADAVLPMKLFTMFTSDERALAHLRAQRSRLVSAVKRVAKHQEWGVRVLLDRAIAIADAEKRVDRRRRPTASTPTGAAYLSRKKAHRDASAELATRARETVAALYDRLASSARLARRRSAREMPAQGGSLLLDAAFLVAKSRSRAFRSLAAREARALAPQGYAVDLTGPWPPYTFVQD
jgi:Gas vesicle synthesis protein GvpL/GvpF